jgi:exonuclease SbcD
MRVLHTGDWHIGKLVHGVHMTEDQRWVLDQLIDLLEEERVEVLIIAGDVYDRSIPPTEAVELLDQVLSQVVMKLGIKVILISGNHDSPDRLDFGGKLLKDQGLHIVGKLKIDQEPIVLEDEFGEIHFHPIPYNDPAVTKAVYGMEGSVSHDEAMAEILSAIRKRMDESVRNVVVSHGFVVGSKDPETSESERPLSIGGTEYVKVKHFDGFDYVALGHLHRPQKVGKETIRYAGSLLKYSFSEAQQHKSITLLDLKEKGNIIIREKNLAPRRDLRVIQGSLDDLLNKEVYTLGNQTDYIHAILTDQEKLYEPMQKLRSVYPNILQLERERSEQERTLSSFLQREMIGKDPTDLFSEFYSKVTGGNVLSQQAQRAFEKVFSEIQQEERDNT